MCGCRAPRAEVCTGLKRCLEHVLQLLVCCVTAQCLQANAPLHTSMILSTVPQLLAYRRREHDPGPQLAGLQPPLRRLILHMIQLEPGDWRCGHSLCYPEDLMPAAPAASCPSSQGRRAQARMQNVVSCVGTFHVLVPSMQLCWQSTAAHMLLLLQGAGSLRRSTCSTTARNSSRRTLAGCCTRSWAAWPPWSQTRAWRPSRPSSAAWQR